MAEIEYSALTREIMSRAEAERNSRGRNFVAYEFVLYCAAQLVVNRRKNGEALDEEAERLYRALDAKLDLVQAILNRFRFDPNIGNMYATKLALNSVTRKARNRARERSKGELTADILAECILYYEKNDGASRGDEAADKAPEEKPESLEALFEEAPKRTEEAEPQTPPQVQQQMAAQTQQQEATQTQAEPQAEEQPQPQTPSRTAEQSSETLDTLIARTKRLQQVLSANVFGQDHAVNNFVSGYFRSALNAMTAKDRTGPLATFLFAGPPGVGKTFLSEQAAKEIGLPFRRFDMSEYAERTNAEQLNGTGKVYMNSSAGSLTTFVEQNPRCVLLFDEIEKAHRTAIYLFLQVLDAGRLRDNQTNREVSFKDTILIFTTNVGKELYEDGEPGKLSMLSRKVILSALKKEINPLTGATLFPPEICSRFASGNVVMFNHLDAHDLRNIVARQLDKHAREILEEMGLRVSIDEKVPPALLMAEGASADARTVKSRADAFWGEELYELFRLASSGEAPVSLAGIREVRFELDLEHSASEVSALLMPGGIPEAIVYTELRYALDRACRDTCRLQYVDDFEAAKKLFQEHDIKFLICGAPDKAGDDSLNREDKDTPARRFLHQFMASYPDVPVYILEDRDSLMSDEERLSYVNRGVRDFLRADRDDPDALNRDLREIVARSVEQQSLNELARANKLISFETRQTLSPDRAAATISLFDMRLEVAIAAEDSQNILSALSRPDVRFDQVIGAEEAKRELEYFVSYLKSPRQFRSLGVGTPKGVLLYGPPGTGKTLLAKAMAGESGLVFISAQGHQFFSKYVGETEENVRRLFATARKYAPSILFIDEIDAIGSARTGSEQSNTQESALTVLLTEMDGFNKDPRKPVFVLAATNYGADSNGRMQLDPALVRRFDRHIYVDLPDKSDRRLFLEKSIKGNALYQISDAEIAALADRSVGMSLAQLTSVLELALRSRVRDKKPAIDDESMEEAFETFNGGERKKWSADQVLRTARHEAGHAFLNWYGGETPSYVTIVSRANFAGYMQHADDSDRHGYTRRELLNRIRTALGGRAAEIVAYGSELGLSTGASGDLRQATHTAKTLLCTYGMDERFGMATIGSEPVDDVVSNDLRQEINRILSTQLEDAVRLIRENQTAVEALADRLMKEDHLNGDEIDRVFSEHAKRA